MCSLTLPSRAAVDGLQRPRCVAGMPACAGLLLCGPSTGAAAHSSGRDQAFLQRHRCWNLIKGSAGRDVHDMAGDHSPKRLPTSNQAMLLDPNRSSWDLSAWVRLRMMMGGALPCDSWAMLAKPLVGALLLL